MLYEVFGLQCVLFYDVNYGLDEGIVEILAIMEKTATTKWLVDYGR